MSNHTLIYNMLIKIYNNYNFQLMWKRWSYKGDPLSSELCNLWFPMFKTRTVQDIFIKPWVKILIGKNNLNVKFLICLFCSPVTMKMLHSFHGASKICIAHTYEAFHLLPMPIHESIIWTSHLALCVYFSFKKTTDIHDIFM